MPENVHIVSNPNSDNVVAKLMKVLADNTGWTIGKQPRPDADINYWWLYLSYAQGIGKHPKLKGKIAAWFSHFEETRPKKQEWWNQAAKAVDIRLTSAPVYYEQLERYGETHLVIPPIDPQFKPETTSKKIIGVSGYVHPGGRKGEHLVSRLHAECHQYNWYMKASGRGWDVDDMIERSWGVMPLFYQDLDVYLCTSYIEGIPMPPLEALASGTPVVIPRGVGLLDYLPDEHVYRYDKGDYDSMIDALHRALHPSLSVKQFSIENWVQSHKIAFGLVDSEPIRLNVAKKADSSRFSPLRNESYTVENAGACIIAYGIPARACAETMLKSWRKEMPDYPIALISDLPLGIETHFIEHEDSDIGARSIKTRLYDLAPDEWEYILYLDADTEIVNDVSILFKWLQSGYDFLICTNPDSYKTLQSGARPDNQDETEYTIQELGSSEIVQPNGGLLGYTRNETTKRFFVSWHSEWQMYGKRDQHSLLRAMKQNPMRWLLLNNVWNTIIKADGTRYGNLPVEDTAGIYHYVMRARRWKGIIEGRLDSDEAWSKVGNNIE